MSKARERINNILFRSLAVRENALELTRREEYISTLPAVKRLGALTLHNLALKQPKITADILGVNLEILNSYEFVGAGIDSIVLTTNRSYVKKYHLGLINQDLKEKRSKAIEFNYLNEKMSRFMGEFMIRQTTRVQKSPLFKSRYVPTTYQKYVDSRNNQNNLNIFKNNPARIDDDELDKVISLHPSIESQLARFVTNGLAMHDELDIVPDTRGPGNIIITDSNKLALVDGLPTLSSQGVWLDNSVLHLTMLSQKLRIETTTSYK